MNMTPHRKFDLEERTQRFARTTRIVLLDIDSKRISPEDKKQLLRSSASVGANYIEANEAISPKDFLLRIKICRKEAKESFYWIGLIQDTLEDEKRLILDDLKRESIELVRIFSSIANKVRILRDPYRE